MIILGVDPSLTSSGYGLLTKEIDGKLKYILSGNITTHASDSLPIRLSYISTKFTEIIQNNKPNVIAMEETFVNMNPVSSLKLAYVRGIIIALAGIHCIDFKEFKPNFIKKATVGVGRADKTQVQKMLSFLIHNLPQIENLDQSDALAVAYVASL